MKHNRYSLLFEYNEHKEENKAISDAALDFFNLDKEKFFFFGKVGGFFRFSSIYSDDLHINLEIKYEKNRNCFILFCKEFFLNMKEFDPFNAITFEQSKIKDSVYHLKDTYGFTSFDSHFRINLKHITGDDYNQEPLYELDKEIMKRDIPKEISDQMFANREFFKNYLNQKNFLLFTAMVLNATPEAHSFFNGDFNYHE